MNIRSVAETTGSWLLDKVSVPVRIDPITGKEIKTVKNKGKKGKVVKFNTAVGEIQFRTKTTEPEQAKPAPAAAGEISSPSMMEPRFNQSFFVSRKSPRITPRRPRIS